ncbi:MAG: zinc finger domain-containing protein [Candidatus Pacearchaeota archaeon]|nr:zinc finger domain-containing protein [Candidatus Pacearchaeota archaeon]
MTEKNLVCSSCSKELLEDEGVIFKCPFCEKKMARCAKCRKVSVKYKCACGFEGP